MEGEKCDQSNSTSGKNKQRKTSMDMFPVR